jgi:hypothetical protein
MKHREIKSLLNNVKIFYRTGNKKTLKRKENTTEIKNNYKTNAKRINEF